MTIIEILNYSKKVIETITEAAVKRITANKFDVKFPEVQKIKGDVSVKFPETQKIHGTVNVANLPTLQKVEVTNQKEIKFPEQKEFPKEIKISNFPTQKEFPKEIKVSNIPSQTKLDTKNIEIGLDGVIKAIEKLPKKFPESKEIKFPEQKEIIIPDKITVKNIETLISDDPKRSVPVRLTDGKEFYKAIEEFYQQVASERTFTDIDFKKTSALVDADRHVQVDVVTMPEIVIPPQTGGSTEAKQDTIIEAIEAIVIPEPTPAIEGFSTEAKQDALAIKIDSLLTELQQKTEPDNVQMSEMIPMLRSILIAIANPSYVDKSANQMRAQITGSLTTVTTVTGVTNLGSFPADHLQRMDNMTAWATNIRNLIT